MKNLIIKKRILSIVLSLIFIFSFAFSTIFFTIPVSALTLKDAFKVDDGKKAEGDPLDYAADKAGYNVEANNPVNTVSGKIAQFINIALSFVGVIFLILMIYGGFLWMTDRGNEAQVKKARGLIEAAIIGMIIVVSAYAITYFVLSQLMQGTLQSQ